MNEQRDRARERLVRVAIAENPVTAQMIHEALEHAGIRSMTKNRDPLSVNTGGGFSLPWALDIYVLEGDADAAFAALGGTPAPEPLPPPSVGGTSPRKRPWWRMFR